MGMDAICNFSNTAKPVFDTQIKLLKVKINFLHAVIVFFNDEHTLFYMAWGRTMGKFEMKHCNDEKGYLNHHISTA